MCRNFRGIWVISQEVLGVFGSFQVEYLIQK